MDRDAICESFIDSLSFSPYPFQEEAILGWFEEAGGLLVSAPTGMGKTLVAEAAIFEALAAGTRLYYTTPLIALTDQKFREFQDKAEGWGFRRDDVGLVTGNRRVNPDAPVKVVVAEILLNHLLARRHGDDDFFADVSGVVMDEFHWFNDPERGVVWELALVLLPRHVRLLLLSATIGNAADFTAWLREKHGRDLRLVTTDQRRVPLEYVWVADRLLTEHLLEMIAETDDANRTPALVFCFVRDQCWEVAERLKGLPLIAKETRGRIEERLDPEDFRQGIGPKLRQMLIRGVGVHHAGVLPRHKAVVEELFGEKLIPFVVCTETLAAGINLPARSVVLHTLLKGKKGEKKPIPPSSAHQIFGRAGRPQFDTRGFVFALAHEDDAKIAKWKVKHQALTATGSKDPNVLRAIKDLERKKPSRRSTEQYWTEGQFQSLIKAGPADLRSRGMIPYPVLLYLLTHAASLAEVRAFLTRRFDEPKRLETFQRQLDHMLANLEGFGYLRRQVAAAAAPDAGGEGDAAAEERVTIDSSVHELLHFRSVDPLFASWLAKELAYADFLEKVFALESLFELPWPVVRAAGLPEREPGPLQRERIEPRMIAMGVTIARPAVAEDEAGDDFNPWKEPEERPPTFPEMLRLAYEADLASPEEEPVRPVWIAGGVIEGGDDFYGFIGSRTLHKNEGLVLRHLLRLVILAGEFFARTEDPDYADLSRRLTGVCRQVDASYTERFLSSALEEQQLLQT